MSKIERIRIHERRRIAHTLLPPRRRCVNNRISASLSVIGGVELLHPRVREAGAGPFHVEHPGECSTVVRPAAPILREVIRLRRCRGRSVGVVVTPANEASVGGSGVVI